MPMAIWTELIAAHRVVPETAEPSVFEKETRCVKPDFNSIVFLRLVCFFKLGGFCFWGGFYAKNICAGGHW